MIKRCIHRLVWVWLLLVVLTFLLPSIQNLAQEPEFVDKTLSPYFLVKSDEPTVDQMPLQATSAMVNIAGVIADVKVKQVYKNEGRRPIEAIYVFPGSTRAAVYGMQMTIANRTIVAKIEKREAARQQYEQAKQEGKSASLLEQQRPNVFQMNVANIMPGDVIEVEMSYTELLVPTDGIYEFVYPTVVGPRYSNTPEATAPASEKWVENPYLHEGELPPYTFDVQVNLSTGLPIQQAVCPSHKVNIQYDGKAFASVKLDESEQQGGNRDFILHYQLAGGQIESGLLLYEGQDENFFLLMAQPPKQVQAENIPAREYIFIMDVSGSMNGYPLDISKKVLKDLIGNLQSHEKFNVLLFAGASAVLSEEGSLPATAENVQRAISVIDEQQGGGGTEILPALQRALALPRTEGMSRTVVIVTDGYVTVEPEVFDLIRNNLGEANLFAFGIGSSVNRLIIEGMARVGMGEPFILTNPEDAPMQADKFRQYIQTPVLTGIDLNSGTFATYDVEPPKIPDVLAERPVIVFGKWKGARDGTITLTGLTGNQQRYEQLFNVAEVTPRPENAALRFLWARHRIQLLGDYNNLQPSDERVEAITDLGLQYSLLTQYTSFVAIDTLVRNKDGQSETVKQPLPLPQGVSDLAVGFDSFLGEKVVLAKPAGVTRGVVNLPAISSDKAIRLSLKKIEFDEDSFPVEGVQAQVEQYLEALSNCLPSQAAAGELVVHVTVDGVGKVLKVEFMRNDVDDSLEVCFIKQIEQWRFVCLPNCTPMDVHITFAIR
jgi:Ca-activated chloride channel homolog